MSNIQIFIPWYRNYKLNDKLFNLINEDERINELKNTNMWYIDSFDDTKSLESQFYVDLSKSFGRITEISKYGIMVDPCGPYSYILFDAYNEKGCESLNHLYAINIFSYNEEKRVTRYIKTIIGYEEEGKINCL